MDEKVRACEQRIGNKWKPARAPMYNRNGVRLYLAYLATLRVGLWTATRTGYTRVIGNCNGSGGGRRSGSLKQREEVNSPCALAVMLYSIYTPRQ